MYDEDEDFEESEQKSSLFHFFPNVSSKIFITLCRSFNSKQVSVNKNSPTKRRDYYKYEQISSSGMSLVTENFLRGNLIRNIHGISPQKLLASIDNFYQISHDPVYLLIAADICRFFSERTSGEEQIKFHLSAFRYSYKASEETITGQIPSYETTLKSSILLQQMQILNEAIAGIFSYLKKKKLLDNCMFTLQGIDGTLFVMEKPVFNLSVPRSAISDFFLCSDIRVKAFRMINRHSGIGVPLVAKVNTDSLSRSLQTPNGLTIPVSILIQVKIHEDRRVSLFPVYQDTSLSEVFHANMAGGDFTWVLARDFTTPLACFMNDLPQRNLLSGMLHPMKYDEFSGLYMVEPYHPGKIPVIFVHGLMSSPETWGMMINSLKYNTEIRQRYQFWFFSYATGIPVLYSAHKLKQALLSAQQEFCTTPEATANFEKMVLVGHSMGGLVVRVLLQQNPYHPLEYFTSTNWEELRKRVSEEDWKSITDFCVIHPLPFVRRAVFMAVPHQGASMAQKGLAQLGVKLIRLPKSFEEHGKTLKRIAMELAPNMKLKTRSKTFVTGIDNLDPAGVLVSWLKESALKKDVTFHSIIGNKKAAAVPGGSDGVVPYHSSHLDNVASELIVKSPHNVQRCPAAIRELMRILLIHLKEFDTEN